MRTKEGVCTKCGYKGMVRENSCYWLLCSTCWCGQGIHKEVGVEG